jgi:serine/threonine-protein kinase
VALLGRGGMGEVYRADDLTLGQQVALKFLPRSILDNPNALERFRNEVRIARRVSHPNVCRVYDLEQSDGNFFLSMEYIDGEDLGALLRRIGRLPSDKALEIARKLCAGLSAAHEKGVLHRDLKPGNVMLDGRGQVLLTDFGLAGLANQIEGAEVRNGTPAYMAPEQLDGKEVTVRSDIYSLGLVLYEILTGKRPFESDTLAGLVQARRNSSLVNPSTLVKDLDPRVERVILRCLESDPQARPATALAVAAALPGGDPLGEALAAGETPSPEMVAAAGEGTGLAPRIAVPLFAAIFVALIVQAGLSIHLSALDRMRLDYSPEVLAQKARDMIQRLGYPGRAVDEAYRLNWDQQFLNFLEGHEKPKWDDILAQRPSLMWLVYRRSDYPLVATGIHDDKMTPGRVTDIDPAPTQSGMMTLKVDMQGRLIQFNAIPPEVQELAKPVPPVDWNSVFAAADLDPTKFQAAEPLWNTLSASDTRAAWTGVWPGTERPLRVEAAAWHGKPVAFSMIGPWTTPARTPPAEPPLRSQVNLLILGGLLLVTQIGGAILAFHNVKRQRGDLRGAFRLAAAIFWVQMCLWLLRAHLTVSSGTFGVFLLAVCTSVFYAAMLWTIYVALEPYVRRHWPQALISWASVLTGRVRDPIVGRDVLFGIALGAGWLMIDRASDFWAQAHGITPNIGNIFFLDGAKATLAVLVGEIPTTIRSTLMYFFLLFLLRVLLRNQWLAGGVFVLIWVTQVFFQERSSTAAFQAMEALILYSMATVVVLRFGMLSLAVGSFVFDLLNGLPVTFNPSAWYFGTGMAVLAGFLALTAWAFRTSIAGRRLWSDDLFG